MSMPWTFADLKRNAFGVILLITLFAVMVPSALNKWANDASPIRSVDVIDAMIKSGQGEGQNIMYLLFLERFVGPHLRRSPTLDRLKRQT